MGKVPVEEIPGVNIEYTLEDIMKKVEEESPNLHRWLLSRSCLIVPQEFIFEMKHYLQKVDDPDAEHLKDFFMFRRGSVEGGEDLE